MRFANAMSLILVSLVIISGCSKKKDTEHSENRHVIRQAIVKPPASKGINSASPRKVNNTPNKMGPATSPGQELPNEKSVKKVEKDQYITEKGDSLAAIAAKSNVYNSYLKWPFLYRNNLKVLADISRNSDFPDKKLPSGLSLRIITPEEKSSNLENRKPGYVIINVASSPDVEKLTPMAVKLIDNGFYAYLTTAEVKGKDWYRLRVGFFKTRSKAKTAGQKIEKLLNITDIWISSIKDDEIQNFGGY